MKVLRQGDRGYEVRYLQRLLNKALRRDRAPGTALVADGVFGPITYAALRAFQSRHRPLVVDGVAGDDSWRALGLRAEREHRVGRYGQITESSCWSAAATMIVGRQCVAPGGVTMFASDNITRVPAAMGYVIVPH
jgi:peptidoglycan hydrolase-like protein with peptidoglycan-binding domain